METMKGKVKSLLRITKPQPKPQPKNTKETSLCVCWMSKVERERVAYIQHNRIECTDRITEGKLQKWMDKN